MKEKEEQRCANCKSDTVYINTHNQLCCSDCGFVEDIEEFNDISIDDDDDEIIPDIHPNCMEDYKSSIEGD